MNYRVVVTPTADAEAIEAFLWYAERSEAAADRWLSGLSRAIAGLSKKPERFPVSQDDTEALGCEARILLHGRSRGVFRILYNISGDTVRILRIRHSAQGPIER